MSICYLYAHRVEDAEELVNESFIKLFKHIEQFDEERKEDLTMALKAWFKRIIINTCIDRYRKKKQHPDESHLEIASERMADHAENGIDILSYKEIIEAIRLLPPSYRTVFNLFVIEGMTHEQIATRLRISAGGNSLVKSRLSIAAASNGMSMKYPSLFLLSGFCDSGMVRSSSRSSFSQPEGDGSAWNSAAASLLKRSISLSLRGYIYVVIRFFS